MTPDHYAILGVSPSSEDGEIRAAYLGLMRRYHPDRNSSAEAAERARAITTAYAVLSDWDRRAEYDLKRARLRSLEATMNVAPRRPPPSPSAIFAVAAVSLLLLVAVRPPSFVRELPELTPAAAPVHKAAAPKPDPAAYCRSPATRDQIRRELFRRAARLRGRDQAAFDRIAGHALVRIDSPELRQADDKLGTVRCEAWVALDLPPGVAVLGGRRNLMADIGYTVKTARGGRGSVRLSGEGLIVTPLATLAQITRPAEQPSVPALVDERKAEALARIAQPPSPPKPAPAPPPARVAPQPARPATQIAKAATQIAKVAPQIAKTASQPARPAAQAAAPQPRPSFSCQIARGRGEIAVCRNAELARLDRHLGMLYGQSWGQADAARREELLGTRDRFITRRDSCRSDACIRAAYLGRMREISDIMATKN